MKKLLFVALTIIILLISCILTGCGKQAPNTSEDNLTTITLTPTPTPKPTQYQTSTASVKTLTPTLTPTVTATSAPTPKQTQTTTPIPTQRPTSTPTPTTTPSVVNYKTYGLNFGPYVDGDPDFGTVITETQVRDLLGKIKPYTNWVRTFGTTGGLENVGKISHEMGMKSGIGAWLGKDLTANNQEIANLINIGNAGQADMLVVGSEVLLRNDLTETQLLNYINQVKAACPGIPVTTADTYNVLLAHPAIIYAVSVEFVNYYPYWEGIAVDKAIYNLNLWQQQMVTASPGKEVIVSETGWPSGGNTVGRAIPSWETSSFYFLNLVSWAKANNVKYFFFEAFDEQWKVKNEGPQGAFWGVWDKNGMMKTGMKDVFDGKTIAPNW